jgi:hypothetical protein
LEALNELGILWWNLVFQIVNFLVVLWLLNRFLYKPIMKMLRERRETIAKGLAEAESVREQAKGPEATLTSREPRRSPACKVRSRISRCWQRRRPWGTASTRPSTAA